MGVQDWDLTKRLALVAKTAVIKGPHIGFSIPNRESHVGQLLACHGAKARRKEKVLEDDEKLRNIAPELRQQFASFAELCRYNSKISKKKGQQYRRNVGKIIGCPFRSRNSFWAVGRGREYPCVTSSATQAGLTAPVVASGASSSSASASALASPVYAPPQITTLSGVSDSPVLPLKTTVRQKRATTLMVCSFGTRTLQNVVQHPSSRCMYSACWSKEGHKRAFVPPEYMEHCMREVWGLSDDVVVRMFFIDCRSLREPSTSDGKHVGLHENLQWGYLQQIEVTGVLDQLRDSLAKLGRTTLFGFYCNAGEHRSVAMAELFSNYLCSTFPEASVELRHACHTIWRRRYCGGCSDCQTRTDVHAAAVERLRVELRCARSPGR
jgi:hypothetical protein